MEEYLSEPEAAKEITPSTWSGRNTGDYADGRCMMRPNIGTNETSMNKGIRFFSRLKLTSDEFEVKELIRHTLRWFLKDLLIIYNKQIETYV